MNRYYIALVGPGGFEESQAAELTKRLAFDVGAEIARSGAVLVCGGLAGAMEEAARGAKSAGGQTIGILPGPDRSSANPFVDFAIPTGMGEARNALVVGAADAIVAVGGGYGTLSEIALALKMHKPVIGLDTWEFSKSGTAGSGITLAHSAQEAVELALAAVD